MAKWQGTAVPNSGYVENVYFNTSLSVDEVVGLLNDVNVPSGYGLLYIPSVTNSFDVQIYEGMIIIVDNNDVIYFHNVEAQKESLGFIGWNPNINYPISINNEVVSSVADSEIGYLNSQLSSLFSTTPFVEVQEQLTLNSFLKNIADAIRSKKGTTEPINAQNFASEIESISGGSNVIEVEEFPTENVQDLTFYKKTIKTNTDVYMVSTGIGMNISLGDLGAIIYEVEELPSNMEISDLENNIFYLYVYDNKAYVNDGSNIMTFGELYTSMGMPFEDKGSIESADQITSDGIYVIYGKEITQIGVNNETYNFIGGVWENYIDIFVSTIDKTIMNLDTPKIKKVGKYAFFECIVLFTVNLPNCITIENSGFAECENMKTINLPICSSIKYEAFKYCSSLTDMYLGNNGVVEITRDTFYGCSKTNVHVRAELLSQYETDSVWAEAVTNGYITLVGDYTE